MRYNIFKSTTNKHEYVYVDVYKHKPYPTEDYPTGLERRREVMLSELEMVHSIYSTLGYIRDDDTTDIIHEDTIDESTDTNTGE